MVSSQCIYPRCPILIDSKLGRKALAAPLRTSFLRSLTTTTQPESQVAESPFIASPFSDAIAKYSKIIENEVDEDEFNAEEEDEDIPAYWNANRPAPRRKDADDVVTNHNLRRTIKKQTGRLGSVIDPHYEPADQLLKPTRSRDITLELLMASQSHLGHATSQWNSMNQRYIYGVRAGVHIISLEETAAHLRRAAKIVEGVAYAGGLILFVGTRKGHMPPVVMAAKLAGACHLFEKWLPGTLTNGNQVLRKCEIIAVDKDDKFVDGFQDKIAEWGALKPDLVVCLNPIENYLLLHECSTNNIPTIGIIDTDADPTWVTYPIPANDDRYVSSMLIPY